MKASELRLGNYIISERSYFDKPEIGKIYQISETNCFFEYFEESVKELRGISNPTHTLKPIELTHEWLVKLGAYKTIDPYKDHYRLENRLIVKRSDGFYDYGSDVLIKHVHQLQNYFYAITGKELEIRTP